MEEFVLAQVLSPCYSAALWSCLLSPWPSGRSLWTCRQCCNVHPTNIIKDRDCKLNCKTFSLLCLPGLCNFVCLNNTSLTDQFYLLICKTSGIFFSLLPYPWYLFRSELIPDPGGFFSLSFSSCLSYNSRSLQMMTGQGHGSNNCMSELGRLIFLSKVASISHEQWLSSLVYCFTLLHFRVLCHAWHFLPHPLPPPGFKKAQQDSKLGFAMSALSSLQHVLCMHVLAAWKIAVHKVLTYFW